MKTTDKKHEFILLRAKGLSLKAIEKQMNINISTLHKWDKTFKDTIIEKKKEELEELYQAYYMYREARIKRLGEVLKKLDKSIQGEDFDTIPLEKRLDLYMKYFKALQDEYITLQGKSYNGEMTLEEVFEAFTDLLNRVKSGEVSETQANRENNILNSLLKGIEVSKLQAGLEEIEMTLEEERGEKY